MADQNASGASKLGLVPVITKAMFSASVRLWTSPFKGSKGAHNYFKDVMFAMMRTQLGNLSLAQDRALAPLTTPNYLKFAQDQKFTPDSLTLPSGTQAHWFGNKNAKKIFIYFHGGGYVMSMGPGHMLWLYDFQNTLISEGADVAVIALAYDVAPEATYPTQLRQAVELLRYLVETEGRDPSDLILGGDSAGGNLTLSLLSHLAHPHPEIPALPLPGKIHAALLISPWVSFNTHVPSFDYNAEKDAFDSRTLSRWSSAFLGSDSPYAGDFYSEPVTAAPSWWEDVANVVSDVLIWGGGNEVLIDGIEEFSRRFTKGFASKGGNVRTVITPKAAHEEMILERILGYKGDSGTGSQPIVHDFVKSKL